MLNPKATGDAATAYSLSRQAQEAQMSHVTRSYSKQVRARLKEDLHTVGTVGNGWRMPDKAARTAAMLLGVLKTNGDIAEGELVDCIAEHQTADHIIRDGRLDVTDECASRNLQESIREPRQVQNRGLGRSFQPFHRCFH